MEDLPSWCFLWCHRQVWSHLLLFLVKVTTYLLWSLLLILETHLVCMGCVELPKKHPLSTGLMLMSSLMILIWKRHLAHVGWFGGGGSTGTGWRYHQAYPGAAGTKYYGPWYSIGIVGSGVLIWGTLGFGFGEDLQKYDNNNSNNRELMWSASWYHSIICAYSISIILQSRDFNGETKMIIIMKLRTAMPTYYYLHKEDHSRESKSKSSVDVTIF